VSSGALRDKQAAGALPLVSCDLAGLDALPVDTIALFCWQDVRPLRGAAGYIDWRTCGALSDPLTGHMFRGEPAEVMLVPSFGRWGQRRMFVFGLGKVADSSRDTLRAQLENAISVLNEAGIAEVMLAAPRQQHRGKCNLEHTFIEVARRLLAGQQGAVRGILVDPEEVTP